MVNFDAFSKEAQEDTYRSFCIALCIAENGKNERLEKKYADSLLESREKLTKLMTTDFLAIEAEVFSLLAHAENIMEIHGFPREPSIHKMH